MTLRVTGQERLNISGICSVRRMSSVGSAGRGHSLCRLDLQRHGASRGYESHLQRCYMRSLGCPTVIER